MNYFDIYFQGKSAQEILNKNNTPDMNKDYNSFEMKPFFQELYNFTYNAWINERLNNNRELFEKEFKVISRDEFEDISDNDFEIVKDFIVRTEALYLANWIYEEEYEKEFFKLFNFKGIVSTLNKLEENPGVFFINKHSIVNIINTFLFGKWIDYYLREVAPINKKRKYEQINKHYFEVILNKAVYYNAKEIDTLNDPLTVTIKKSEENNYWLPLKDLMKSYTSFLINGEPQEYKEDRLPKCIYDYRQFRKEVLNEISKYLITFEEIKDDSELFKMTHMKRLLLYELLRHLEPTLNLPPDAETYSKKTTSDRGEAEKDKSLFYSTTPRFDDFKRNEVRKHFG